MNARGTCSVCTAVRVAAAQCADVHKRQLVAVLTE
jgi:hypothetical protein